MQPTQSSWEGFDPKAFEETVCAGGAEGVSSHAPEHMLGGGVMTFTRGIDSDKPDEENLADKPPVDEKEIEANMRESTLKEQDQNAVQQQPVAQSQPQVQAPVNPTPAAQVNTQPVTQAPVQNTQAAPVQPQPANPQQQVSQAAPAQPTTQTPVAQAAQPVINTQPQNVAPQSQIVNNPQPVQESWEGFSMKEAHYDPADYWDEDPEWDVIPAGVRMTDVDRELCNKHRVARQRRYGKPTGAKLSNYTAAVANSDERHSASKKFWADAKTGKVNIEEFHKAYDMELNEYLRLNELFNDSGYLASRSTYGKIKSACESKPDSWACKALKKLWVLQYTVNESTTNKDIEMNETKLFESSWDGITGDVIKENLKECDMDSLMFQAEPDYELGKTVEVPLGDEVKEPEFVDPYDGIPECNGDYYIVNKYGESTTWEGVDTSVLKESIALPGGRLNAEPTEYEKELEKHNQARKNTKSPEVKIGDKDAGEIGIHDFDENGLPTGVKEKVKTDIKATEIKPNKKAVEVDQKKKWDD